MTRTNYVLCAWSGERRTPDPRRDADPAVYLREHIQSLQDLRHGLDQITIMVPYNPTEPSAFRQFLNTIPSMIQDAKVVIMERPNVGMSYGSLSDCYARYRLKFDFYMMMEDDYVFTQGCFDWVHVEALQHDLNCGYVCGRVSDSPPPTHAAVANGMFRGRALEAVFFAAGGWLPHAKAADYQSNEKHGQMGQSQAIITVGYTLRDWTGRYRIEFREENTSITTFNPECAELLMRPV